MKDMIQKSLSVAQSYTEFRNLVQEKVDQNSSTGVEPTEALAHYTLLNDKRMKRLDKKVQISEEAKEVIAGLDKELIFLVLMESWCGDGAQSLPVINKIVELSDKIDYKIVLRDENDELMQQFLTNGSKSIPKLIVLDKVTLDVLTSWGPRPKALTKLVNEYKKEHGSLDAAFKQEIQVWYNKDKGVSTQDDIIEILKAI